RFIFYFVIYQYVSINMRKNKHFFRRENKSLRRENRENLVRVFQSSLFNKISADLVRLVKMGSACGDYRYPQALCSDANPG
ncbi:MAG: hypothetical protein KKH29_06200, partial [Candidatus Omnitrophica bacterium]|nr:hypothetical protein [Candidatus Omnitrophota bacterium]